MKGYIVLITLFTVLLGMTGCGNRPIPKGVSYPHTFQQRMQATHHWDVLATDVAKRIRESLGKTFPNAVVPPSILIRYTQEHEKVAFGKAFHRLLRTQLMQNGIVVMAEECDMGCGGFNDMLILDYDVQVVHHKDRRLRYPPPFGSLTALAAGVWLVAYGAEHWNPEELAIAPAALGADSYSAWSHYFPGETNTEVAISTTLTMPQNKQYVFSDTNIYYVNTGDMDHYEDDSKTFAVVGCPQDSVCQ